MSARVDVYEEGPRRWRWAWRDGNVELLSNQVYATEMAARSAARIAYPDVVQSGARMHRPSGDGRPTRTTLVLMLVAVWRWYRQARRA
jgi:hypothetical protein